MWNQKYLIWVLLGQAFKKTIAILEISPLQFVKMQSFVLKKNHLCLGLKFLYLEIFGLEFEKTIVIFEFDTLELDIKQIFK